MGLPIIGEKIPFLRRKKTQPLLFVFRDDIRQCFYSRREKNKHLFNLFDLENNIIIMNYTIYTF